MQRRFVNNKFGMEGNCHGIIESLFGNFLEVLNKNTNNSVRTADVSAEFRTVPLRNTSGSQEIRHLQQNPKVTVHHWNLL
jgi:hypothetical protein